MTDEICLDGVNYSGRVAHGSTLSVPYDAFPGRIKFGNSTTVRIGEMVYDGRILKTGKNVHLKLSNRGD